MSAVNAGLQSEMAYPVPTFTSRSTLPVKGASCDPGSEAATGLGWLFQNLIKPAGFTGEETEVLEGQGYCSAT